jgi:hypothetical protein
LEWNDYHVERFLQRYGDFAPAAFKEYIAERESYQKGVDAVKLLTFVPVAIALSCLFAFLNLFNVLSALVGQIVLVAKGKLKSLESFGLGVGVFLLIYISVSFLSEPANTLASQLYSGYISEKSVFLDVMYHSFLRMQDALYKFGSSYIFSPISTDTDIVGRCMPVSEEV